MAKKKEQALTKIEEQETALATLGLGQSNAEGMEETDRDCFLIPQIKLLQKMSPQVDEDNAKYVPGAKPGLFLLTTTGDMWESEKDGILVIPAYFQRRFLEFIPQEGSSDKFNGIHLPTDRLVVDALHTRDKKGRFWLETGNYLQDTRIHYVILLHRVIPMPAVVTLKSSQIPKSKGWITAMNKPLLISGDPEKDPESCRYDLKPACEFRIYRLTSRPEANSEHTWKGYRIVEERVVTEADIQAVEMARHFRKQIRGGETTVDYDEDDTSQNVGRDF